MVQVRHKMSKTNERNVTSDGGGREHKARLTAHGHMVTGICQDGVRSQICQIHWTRVGSVKLTLPTLVGVKRTRRLVRVARRLKP